MPASGGAALGGGAGDGAGVATAEGGLLGALVAASPGVDLDASSGVQATSNVTRRSARVSHEAANSIPLATPGPRRLFLGALEPLGLIIASSLDMSPLAPVLVLLSAAAVLLSHAHTLAYAPDDGCGQDDMHVYFSGPLPQRFDLLLDGKPCVSVFSSGGRCTITATPQSACYEMGDLTLVPSGCFEEEGEQRVSFHVRPGHRPRVGVPFTMVARIWTRAGVRVRQGRTSMDFWVPQFSDERCYYGVARF